MNDQAQMMNLNQSQQMMSMSQPQQMLNQQQQQQQQQVMNQKPQQMLSQPPQLMSQSQMMMTQSQQSQPMLNRGGYPMWPPMDQLKFQNPMNFPGFGSSKQSKPLGRSNNWKGKKGNDKRKDGRRMDIKPVIGGSSSAIGIGGIGGGGGYKPPTLKELQYQNRLKARRHFPKKNFNNRSAPYAPRNTTSFIIRAKKSGGIASLVSPCPVTPAVLPTPIFSPSREVLVDMAKEEWGVDGYGSMKGLIRLRSPGNEADVDEEEEEGGSSESDVEEHLEVERRLDHDLSRFEMIYPNYGGEYNNVLENRVDDQDTHIAHVEEENLILKERLFLMERELGDLRRRLISLERQSRAPEVINEQVLENESENDSESGGYSRSMEENNEEVVDENHGGLYVEANKEDNCGDLELKEVSNVENHDGDVEFKEAFTVQANEEYNDRDVEVKEANTAEKKKENKDGDVEVKESNIMEAKEDNNGGCVEVKAVNIVETINDTGVGDVCMELIAENWCKDEGIENECTEKTLGEGGLSDCSAPL